MEKPFFSIIVPVYNTPISFLNDCICSLTCQKEESLEILLVDDGSMDICARQCDEIAARDSRIRVIHQVNQGVSAARNRGIAEAQGEWILFVDADDWIEPDTCEILKKRLYDQKCDMLLFNLVKEANGRTQALKYGLESGRLYDNSDAKVRELLYRRAMCPPNLDGQRLCPIYYSCDKVFRRQFLTDNSLCYPVGLPKSEDKVFILRCFQKMERLYYVDDVLYYYRMNEGSACHKFTPSADIDRQKLAVILFDIAKEMDAELAALLGIEGYDRITKGCYGFQFGIITDVLLLKYFHPDNPDSKKIRIKDARVLINSEPFKSAIAQCEYGTLSVEGKLKKFLLSRGQVACFIKIYKMYRKLTHRPI